MKSLYLSSLLLCLFTTSLFGIDPTYSVGNISKTPHLKSFYQRDYLPNKKFAPPMVEETTLIVLDPGHGGQDMGTQSITKPRYSEKSLNLVTAKFVKQFLEELGYRVMMTREKDDFVSLEKRVQIANDLAPKLFVSIHFNSAPSALAQGIEVYYYLSKENKRRNHFSRRLASIVLKNAISQTHAKSRGVKTGNFVVIRDTSMPAILVEGGFVSNQEEMENLKDPNYLKQLAWGIVKGIDSYTQHSSK